MVDGDGGLTKRNFFVIKWTFHCHQKDFVAHLFADEALEKENLMGQLEKLFYNFFFIYYFLL